VDNRLDSPWDNLTPGHALHDEAEFGGSVDQTGFDSGAIAHTRFAVAGEAPKVVDDNLLDQFRKEPLTDDQLGEQLTSEPVQFKRGTREESLLDDLKRQGLSLDNVKVVD
jgi:hypothetical protein